jgi:hypothetical protein
VRQANAGGLQSWCVYWRGRNRCGYADPKGRIVIAPRFDEVEPFNEKGQAKVKWRGQWLWIDARGNTAR